MFTVFIMVVTQYYVITYSIYALYKYRHFKHTSTTLKIDLKLHKTYTYMYTNLTVFHSLVISNNRLYIAYFVLMIWSQTIINTSKHELYSHRSIISSHYSNMPPKVVLIGCIILILFSSSNCKQENTHQHVISRQSNASSTPTMTTTQPPPKPSHFALELVISFLNSLSQIISPVSGILGSFINATITGLLNESITQLESISRVDATRMFLVNVPGRGQFVVMRKSTDDAKVLPTIAEVLPKYENTQIDEDYHRMSLLMQFLMKFRQESLY